LQQGWKGVWGVRAVRELQINEQIGSDIQFQRQHIHTGALILVNVSHPLRLPSPQPELVELPGGVLLEKTAAHLLIAALRHVGATKEIVFVSGYRSHLEQIQIYNDTKAERGEGCAQTFVALPGCSEHESGLAIDLALRDDNIDFITPEFPYSGICQAIREASARYGFIQRYPQGKEAITGIGHEPWHFRYVGWPHSAIISEHDFTLEEYTQWLKAFPYPAHSYVYSGGGKAAAVSYIPASKSTMLLRGDRQGPMTVSGNNVDGFVVTVWRESR